MADAFRHIAGLHVWPGEHVIDVVNELGEDERLAVARLREGDAEIDADMAGIAAEHDDAVGQQDGFFDVVGYEKDGAGGDGLLLPQLQEFAAEVLRGEHVEGGEGLVHEKDLRLNNERAGKADTLPHAAGELLGEGGLKAVQTDGVDDAQAALASLVGAHAACLQRGLHIFEHSQPGEEGEALEDDGDVGVGASDGLCRANRPRPLRAC